jgi:hypothetical protein
MKRECEHYLMDDVVAGCVPNSNASHIPRISNRCRIER